jgi:predicted RNA-binding Zn ribbon-like protein
MSATTSANNLPLLGGALCLDFANTVSWRGREEPKEWLTSYDDLVAWACRAHVVSEGTGRKLRRAARARPADAAAALQRARELREAMYRAFSRQAGGHGPARGDLERIRAHYADAVGHATFAAQPETDRWMWLEDGGEDLDQVTRAVARSGVELATSSDLARVRECQGEACGWLFLDQSRNRSRRWCSSADCGNRARVRRFYERRRGTTR